MFTITEKGMQKQLDLFPDTALRIVFSNDMRVLAQRLGEEIFSRGLHPFDNRLIVVPDLSLKEFLLKSFVDHPRLKMAAGVKIISLNQAVSEIVDLNKKRIPSLLELSLAIEEKLHQFIAEKRTDESLLRYLHGERRISALSDELAKLFRRYGLYGANFLPAWLSEKNPSWQQALWNEIYSPHSPWTYPLELLKKTPTKPFSGKICLIGFSYLAPVHLSFFSSLKAVFFQLSSSSLFWQDTVSEKERLFIGNLLKKKGAKENLREEMDQYMQQGHPLLGNWGKLGKELLKSLDAFDLIEEDAYEEPQDNNLLTNLKKSLLNLDELKFSNPDGSLQVHSAASRLREVEVLKDSLETLLHEHAQKGDPIPPREILVVCPDISLYAPYIQMVFAQSELPFAIHGIPISSFSPSVQGFLQLLKLDEERFALASVCKLWQCSAFREKNGFSLEEVHQLGKWFKQAEIREKLSAHPNSWEEGLDRLLYGLALVPSGQAEYNSWPIASILQSEIDLFNRFLELFEKIKADLSMLSGEKSAGEWLTYFLRIADQYFDLEWERDSFFQQLKALSLSCRSLKQRVWNFESIQRVLFHLAQIPLSEISSSQLQRITFTLLRQGNLRPARIVWCLGMDEGAFPRSDSHRSLCEMSKHHSSDYFPSQTDEDRALFLEMLLKTRDHLIFSYQRLNLEDEKQQGPCLLIEELNQYLINQGLSEGIMHCSHPSLPFDQTYFSEEGKIKKWAMSDFLAAKAYYFPHRIKPKPLVEFRKDSDDSQEIVIQMSQLKKFARHPLQFYFNETLKITLKGEEDDEEKEFLLSYLRKSILRKKALKTTLPQTMKQWRAQGKLPSGLFQDVAWHDLEEEVGDLLEHLHAFGVRLEEIKTIHLPALSIPLSGGKTAVIVGKLEDVTPKGLLFHGERDLKSLVRAWPLYLVSLCTDPSSKLLFTKSGEAFELKVDPKTALSSYIEYFLMAKHSPSPLMPEWASALLKKSEQELWKAMSQESGREDAYLSYLQRRQGLFDPKEIFALWGGTLRQLFAPLLEGLR